MFRRNLLVVGPASSRGRCGCSAITHEAVIILSAIDAAFCSAVRGVNVQVGPGVEVLGHSKIVALNPLSRGQR